MDARHRIVVRSCIKQPLDSPLPDPSHGILHIVMGTDFLTVETWGKAPGAGTLDRTKEIAALVVKRFKEQYKG